MVRHEKSQLRGHASTHVCFAEEAEKDRDLREMRQLARTKGALSKRRFSGIGLDMLDTEAGEDSQGEPVQPMRRCVLTCSLSDARVFAPGFPCGEPRARGGEGERGLRGRRRSHVVP